MHRAFFLDWLRIAAFSLLVLYHVGMLYVGWDWHLKSPHAGPALEPLMRLSNPWRMGLLFVLSGAATAFMLQARPQGLLRERSRRLLLPLMLGVALVVPPQAYFEVVQKLGYAGSYLDFLQRYFTGYSGFCRGSDCLVLPTWNHLWFLPYLWCYTALLLLLRAVLPAAWRAGLATRCAVLAPWQWWLLPVLALAVIRLTLLSRFPSTHALVDDWFNHASYGLLFLLGVGLGAQPQHLARLQALRWPALVLALLCWAGIEAYLGHVTRTGVAPEGLRALQRVAYAALQWSAIVAALGFAHRHLNTDHPWRARLSEAVFPVYLVHQTVIIVAAMVLMPRALPVGLEAAGLVLLAFAGSAAFWWLARSTGPLRPWLGLPRRLTCRWGSCLRRP